MEINKIINDQLTCGKCFKQFGSIQALKKHLDARKCQGIDDCNIMYFCTTRIILNTIFFKNIVFTFEFHFHL